MFEKSVIKASKCLKHNDFPVYACIFKDSTIIAQAINTKEKNKLVSGHAEINVINKVFKKHKITNLSEYELFTTLEPCEMCYQAIKQAKIKKIHFLLANQKFGYNSKNSINDRSPIIKQIHNKELSTSYKKLLKQFFANKR